MVAGFVNCGIIAEADLEKGIAGSRQEARRSVGLQSRCSAAELPSAQDDPEGFAAAQSVRTFS